MIITVVSVNGGQVGLGELFGLAQIEGCFVDRDNLLTNTLELTTLKYYTTAPVGIALSSTGV